MSEITTAEHYLLVKLFEAEGEAEAAKERLAEMEEAFSDVCAAARAIPEGFLSPDHKCYPAVMSLLNHADRLWEKLYTPDEVEA